jgi:hypothetical protein|tara:strand:+ start:4592 stop:4693 length:102 start_codon:yes stop_codon:yes gene_type:complete
MIEPAHMPLVPNSVAWIAKADNLIDGTAIMSLT